MSKKVIITIAILLILAGTVIRAAFINNDPPGKDERKSTVRPKQTDTPEGMVALVIDLPEESLKGTPKNLVIENLEARRPEGQMRPPFYVPAGTSNAALGKTVTSTSYSPIAGEFGMITDGDKSGYGYVELDPFEQSITIDLGASYEIYAIVLWHNFKDDVAYFDVVIQTADDADFIMNVNTLFNNDTDNTHGLGTGEDKNYIETNEGKLIDANGVGGRYVRCYSASNSSNDMNHYIEVEVYAK